MSEENSEELKEILQKSGSVERVIKSVLIKDSGVGMGENMVSKTNTLVVTFEDDSEKLLKLFMKSALDKTKNPMGEAFEEAKMFEKEARFFTEYLPAVREFLAKKGKEDLMQIYPLCYHADKTKVILEHLGERDFEQLDKTQKQDFQAAKICLESLAKHHAISRAFIQKKFEKRPEDFFQRFTNLNFESFEVPSMRQLLEPGVESGLDILIKLVEKRGGGSKADADKDALKLFKESKGHCFDKLLQGIRVHPGDDKMLVLNHGDSWNNNMMFKKDKTTEEILAHILIDFQVLRWNTPSVDIAYFLFTSVDQSIRRKRLEELFQIYLETFNTIMRDLSGSSDHCVTYDELFTDFRRKFKYGFWISVMMANATVWWAVMKHLTPEMMAKIDMATEYQNLIDKWIAEHPDEAGLHSASAVELAKEFLELDIE